MIALRLTVHRRALRALFSAICEDLWLAVLPYSEESGHGEH
jgi:hypothetical protein